MECPSLPTDRMQLSEHMSHLPLLQVDYPEIEEGSKPRHRFMSAFEQRKEAQDRRFQFLLFAADPYEVISFKIPNTEVDRSERLFSHWWGPDAVAHRCVGWGDRAAGHSSPDLLAETSTLVVHVPDLCSVACWDSRTTAKRWTWSGSLCQRWGSGTVCCQGMGLRRGPWYGSAGCVRRWGHLRWLHSAGVSLVHAVGMGRGSQPRVCGSPALGV